MRSLIIFGLFVIFLVAVQFASAKTVDEVIEKYEEARGGRNNLRSLKSIYMEGNRQMNGNVVAVKIIKEQDQVSRTEFEMAGYKGFTLVTKNDAWSFIPMRSPSLLKMQEEDLLAMQPEMDIAGPLVDYVGKGHRAELMAKENLDGINCFKIKLTTNAGKQLYYWIDTSSYQLIQSSFINQGWDAVPGEKYLLYKDYKKVGGFLFAHQIEMKNTGKSETLDSITTYHQITINQPVDNELYKPE